MAALQGLLYELRLDQVVALSHTFLPRSPAWTRSSLIFASTMLHGTERLPVQCVLQGSSGPQVASNAAMAYCSPHAGAGES